MQSRLRVSGIDHGTPSPGVGGGWAHSIEVRRLAGKVSLAPVEHTADRDLSSQLSNHILGLSKLVPEVRLLRWGLMGTA